MTDRVATGPSFGKLVAAATAAVTLIAAVVTLVFQVDPGIAPCLGGRNASFTGAPVFPRYPYPRFLADLGQNPAGYPDIMGAEVRYSFEVDDLRRQTLVLYYTLVSIARDGTIASVDTNALDHNDLFRVQTIRPDQCSQGGGRTFFAHLPAGAHGHYEIYLELYRGPGYADRIALGHTPVFDG